MFAKDKVSQAMLDAVNSVLDEGSKLLLEPESEKVPTPTGTKVYGHSYGNSAKARKDQTAHDVDKLKGPKDKEMKEELKGNQDKIDAQDFKILRGKKKVEEGREFTEKLLSSIHEKKDVVLPEETPAKNTDIADKSYLKDMGKKPTVKSDLKNLGRFLTGKKETNEDVESLDEVKKMDDASRDLLIHAHAYATGKVHKKMMNGGYKDKGEMAIHHAQELHHALSTLGRGEKLKEDVTEQGLDEMINEVLGKDATAGEWIDDFVHSDNPKFAGKSKAERKKMALGAYYGAQKEEVESLEEKNWIAGAIKHPGAMTAAAKRAGESNSEYEQKHKHDSGKTGKRARLALTLKGMHKEEADITTDEISGRKDGGNDNDFKKYKVKLKGDITKEPATKEPEDTASRKSIKTKEPKANLPNLKVEEEFVDETTIAGSTGWEKVKKNVTDKSGAVHTPMSRARNLARLAFQKVNSNLGKTSK